MRFKIAVAMAMASALVVLLAAPGYANGTGDTAGGPACADILDTKLDYNATRDAVLLEVILVSPSCSNVAYDAVLYTTRGAVAPTVSPDLSASTSSLNYSWKVEADYLSGQMCVEASTTLGHGNGRVADYSPDRNAAGEPSLQQCVDAATIDPPASNYG